MSGIFPTTKSQTVKIVVIIGLLIVLAFVLANGFNKAKNSAPSLSARQREWLAGEGAFFVRKNCTDCHSISAFGIQAATIGPDLSEAVVDTQKRFGKSLEEFLRHPNGTMSIVLSSRTPLTEAEKQEAIRLLRIAYQRKQEQQSPPNN